MAASRGSVVAALVGARVIFSLRWLVSARVDLVGVILAPFWISCVFWWAQPWLSRQSPAFFIALLTAFFIFDYVHVFSTAFKTLSLKSDRRRRWGRYLVSAVVVLGLLLVLVRGERFDFWMFVAYANVVHSWRQPYGILRLYTAGEGVSRWSDVIDRWLIHLAVLYPLVYSHAHAVPEDFYWIPLYQWSPWWAMALERLAWGLLVIAVLLFFGKEVWSWRRGRPLHVVRWLVIGGTALNWWLALVHLQAHYLMVVPLLIGPHALAYLVIVYADGRKRRVERGERHFGGLSHAVVFSKWGYLVTLGLLAICGYIFNGIEDQLLYNREWWAVSAVFERLRHFSAIDLSSLSLWLPLLYWPQVLHFLWDGWIWKFSAESADSHYLVSSKN